MPITFPSGGTDLQSVVAALVLFTALALIVGWIWGDE